MTEFDSTSISEFAKDKKRLKADSIDDDLETFEKAFEVDGTKLPGIIRISRLGKKGVNTPIYKARKFRCKSMGGGARSGVRLVFAYIKEDDKVFYIEIYKKNRKSNHDEKRIVKYFIEKSKD